MEKTELERELLQRLGVELPYPLKHYGVNSEVKFIAKGENLVRQGDCAPDIFYLKTGLVRYCSVTEDGKDYTQALTIAPAVVGSTRAMVKKLPSLVSIEALQDTLCLSINWKDLYQGLASQPGFYPAYIQILENLFIQKEERENDLVKLSAEQRYLNFIHNNPDLLKQVPLQYIASFIGITPVALSRIRAKLKLGQV